MGNARPSVTKKQREQKKRERRLIKAEKRAQRKLAASKEIFTEAVDRLEARAARRHALDWTPLLRPFRGTHPEAARDWIAARRDARERAVGPRCFRLGHLRLYLSDWIERLTGARVFEYRNYVDV